MDNEFGKLGLNEQILAGVEALGFTDPTPVQAGAIPRVLEGRDAVASAQTGTGKTAAFTLPTLQRIAGEDGTRRADKRRRGPFALVVTPTRELAQQIDKVASVVCAQTGQRATIVVGGTKFDRQIAELERGCDMLVATPGRLLDLIEHNHVSLSQVETLVLDEADRMLDMGFWPSIRRIMHELPAKHQTLLFSATIPPSIKSTIDALLTDPVTVEIARTGETADTVEEHLCPVTQGQKTQLLEALLDRFAPERVLVFCRTKHRVDDVCKLLKKAGVKVDVMHADRPQGARERALEKFRAGKIQVLVATDVMSRGIDVSGIDAVVNFDVPMDPEDYVHRIGRTGRAGATGHAYTFVAPDEISPLREIEYFTGKLVPVWDLEGFDYDSGRIVPNSRRSTSKPTRTMFSGSRSRGRGPRGGRYGRHY
ncbi:DEAD/DEAH box helicase [Atopobiaceae bacterium LCP21S3_F11]